MFFDFLKKRPKIIRVDENGDVKDASKRGKWIIYIIVAAIVILAFSGSGETGKKEKNLKDGEIPFENFQRDEYISQLETELEEILQTVKGAGKVKTMITVTEYGERVVATDKKRETSDKKEGENTDKAVSEEQTTVLYGSGTDEKPFVVKERVPLPSGVLVVAEGAADESVRLELYESVKALYGISGHRIKIACKAEENSK